MKKCKLCGELTEEGLKTPIGFLCESCADDNDYHECEFCGKVFQGPWTDLGEMTFVCDECLDNDYVKCSICGSYFSPEDLKFYKLVDDKCYCNSCYERIDDKQ